MKTNDYVKWLLYALLFATLVTPFIVGGSFFFPYITAKVFTFRILVELAFLVWVFLALRDPKYRPKLSGILLAFALFLFFYIIAGLLGQNPGRSFWSDYERMSGGINYLHMFAYFLILMSAFRAQKIWHWFFGFSLLMSVIVGFNGLVHIGANSRIDSTLGNPIYLAIYALLNAFLALFLIFHTKKLKYPQYMQWVYGAAGVFNIVVLFFTGTRGTQLGLVGAVFVMALLLAIFENKKKWIRGISIAVCVVIAILPLLFLSVRHTSFVQDTPQLARYANISATSGDGHARLMLWNMAAHAFPEHPFLGYGPENFQLVFAEYYDPGMYAQEQWFDRAHDIIFDRLISTGILGLLSYLLIFLFFFYSLWNIDGLRRFFRKFFSKFFREKSISARIRSHFVKRNYEGFTFYEKVILTGALVGYFIHLLFVFDDLASLMLLAVLLAFVASQVSLNRKPLFGDRPAGGAVRSSVMLCTGVVVFVGIYFANYLPIQQNLTLIQALRTQDASERLVTLQKALSYNTFGDRETREQVVQTALQLSGTNTSKDTLQTYYLFALKQINDEIAATPEAPRGYFFKATLFAHFGQFDKALAAINQALELSPNKQQFLELKTSFLWRLEKYDQAVKVSKFTYELDKADKKAAKFYASSLIYAGEVKQADTLLESVFGTALVPDQQIINAYAQTKNFDMVVKLWQKKVEANAGDIQAHVSLSYAYFKAGKEAKAAQELEDVAKAHPELKDKLETYIKDYKAGIDPAKG